MPTVTHTPDRTATERKRRQRERQRDAANARAPLLFERADWQLFLRRETLPQKAGCEPGQIARIVLKEVVDNALDTGSDDVTIDEIPGGWRVTDRGPGIEPEDVPRFFAVNRPLLSSKLKRLPLRGMLGNGLRVVMGAVAAFNGKISVTSRGHRLALAIDNITGETRIAGDELAHPGDGTTIEITLPGFTGDESAPPNCR
jgi:signal transduction histidine kinase